MNYQKLIVVANVTSEPSMRYLPDGTPVCSFSIPLHSGHGDKQKTTWAKVACWRKLAEVVSQYVVKGQEVTVEGKITEVRTYQRRDGQPGVSLEVTADSVTFGSKGEAKEPKEDKSEIPDIEDGAELPF